MRKKKERTRKRRKKMNGKARLAIIKLKEETRT